MLDRMFLSGSSAPDVFAATITTNQNQLNLATWATANGWDGSKKAEITIAAGVYVYSDSTATPALTTGSFPGGLKIINAGYIAGRGGDGGGDPDNGAPQGLPGGPAISLGMSCEIQGVTGGYIGGGGGGGGSAASTTGSSGGGGGGGGGAGGGASMPMRANKTDCLGSGNAPVGSAGSDGTKNTSSSTDTDFGRGGGSGGGGGSSKATNLISTGGGGGWIFPGTGGAGGSTSPNFGGNGGSSNQNGARGTYAVDGGTGGGGGGWGATGGYGQAVSGAIGGAGGKAVNLNGYTVTWTGTYATNLSSYVFGAIS